MGIISFVLFALTALTSITVFIVVSRTLPRQAFLMISPWLITLNAAFVVVVYSYDFGINPDGVVDYFGLWPLTLVHWLFTAQYL